jgi:large subunit ribosomal protein L21e
MGTVRKGMLQKCYHSKTRRAYNVTQRAVGAIIVNRKAMGKILARRINVPIEHIKHTRAETAS